MRCGAPGPNPSGPPTAPPRTFPANGTSKLSGVYVRSRSNSPVNPVPSTTARRTRRSRARTKARMLIDRIDQVPGKNIDGQLAPSSRGPSREPAIDGGGGGGGGGAAGPFGIVSGAHSGPDGL